MKEKNITSGRNYIWSLVKYRFLSEQEIRDKLKSKDFPFDVTEELIRHFKNLKIIDDRAFTKSWIETRLDKPLGFKAIEFELSQKGINKDLIKEIIAEFKLSVNETELARGLILKKLKISNDDLNGPNRVKNLQKAYNYLLNRGFRQSTANEILSEFNNENGYTA